MNSIICMSNTGKVFKRDVHTRTDLSEIVSMQEAIYFGTFLGILPLIRNDAVMRFRLMKYDY